MTVIDKNFTFGPDRVKYDLSSYRSIRYEIADGRIPKSEIRRRVNIYSIFSCNGI
jgi:hypothetical protein